MMSSLDHSTSNNEDAFSSNISNYVSTIPNYFPTSWGKTYSKASNNSTGKIPPEFLPFYNMKDIQAFYAKELPIPSPYPITPPVILTPSLVLPPLLLFDPLYFFVPKELLPPKKQIHPPSSSSTTLSKLSRKQIYTYEPSSPLVHTPTLPLLYEPGKEALAATMANTDNPNRNLESRETHVAKRGNYKEFISCQPFYFNGTEGAAGPIRWFERTELVFSRSKCAEEDRVKFATDAAFADKENECEVHVSPSSSYKTKKHDEKVKREAKGKSHVELSIGVRDLSDEFKEFSVNSTIKVNAASVPVIAVGPNSTDSTNSFSAAGPSNTAVSPSFEIGGKYSFMDPSQYPDDPNMPTLEDIIYSDDEEDVGAEADFSNFETSITVSPIPTTRVHKDHPVTHVIGDLSSAPQTRSMARMVKEQEERKRVHKALKDPIWIEAMQEELLQFKMQKVLGHTQEEGIDYKEVFAPVARIEAIRVYKVVKALYGLHQAPRAWYETLANYLLENGFQRGKIDQTLFIKKQKGDILLVQVYVDDIIFGSTNKELCKAFEKLMKDKFQMSLMGELTFFLGLQVKKKDNGIFISQDKYVAKILRKFSLVDGKSASTPIDTEQPLLKDPDGEDVDTVVTTSSTEAEYVAATSCCAQVLWAYVSIKKTNDVARLQALIDRKKVIITEAQTAQPSSLPPLPPQPSQTTKISMTLFNTLLETCATLTKQVANLEQEKIAQAIEISKLKQRVRRRMHPNRGKIVELDADKDVTLEKVDVKVAMDDTDEAELAEVEEVIELFTAAKLMTEVVTTAATTITAAQVPKASVTRRRRGVIIQDPEETATASVIVHSKAKSKDKGKEDELNANINWNDVMEQVKRKEKQDNTVMRYQALKRKPVTEAQARKNMMIYLKNMAGFKMDFFKGMTYNEIRSIFEKHCNLNQAFLERVEEEVIGQKEDGNKRKGENLNQDAAKKQRIDEEVEELKTHLQIVANDDDDVYTKANPLALKVPVFVYETHHEHNKPYYKIIRADGTHQLFLSFIIFLKNFDREDLEIL
uniref:Reverse transcriptase Ty1/copia-type domain-containing protein n=1 Tax=Tanacetum cinerariifolium TaxID=118510 RepID=A0A6L2KMH3_TANCI|nr:hypothetical protein [Tanacetum cinerariifolium]